MVDNKLVSLKLTPNVARPVSETDRGTTEPTARPVRLRLEEVEPRIAPNAIWGD
jgi:hypothetical protein